MAATSHWSQQRHFVDHDGRSWPDNRTAGWLPLAAADDSALPRVVDVQSMEPHDRCVGGAPAGESAGPPACDSWAGPIALGASLTESGRRDRPNDVRNPILCRRRRELRYENSRGRRPPRLAALGSCDARRLEPGVGIGPRGQVSSPDLAQDRRGWSPQPQPSVRIAPGTDPTDSNVQPICY